MSRPMSLKNPQMTYFRSLMENILANLPPSGTYTHRTSSYEDALHFADSFHAYRSALRNTTDPDNKTYNPGLYALELENAERFRLSIPKHNKIVIFRDFKSLTAYQGIGDIFDARQEIAELTDPLSTIQAAEVMPDKADELIKTLYSTAPLTITPQTAATPEPAPRRIIPRPPGADIGPDLAPIVVERGAQLASSAPDVNKRANLSPSNSPPSDPSGLLPTFETKE